MWPVMHAGELEFPLISDLLKDTKERAPEAGGDAGAREALSRHGRVGDQICKQREDE